MIKRVSYIKPFVYNNKIDAYWLQHDLSFFIEIIHWRVQSLMKMIQRMKYSIHSTTKSTTTTKVIFCIGNQDKSDEASWFYSLIAKFHLSYIKKWHFFRSLAFTNNFWSEVGLVLAPIHKITDEISKDDIPTRVRKRSNKTRNITILLLLLKEIDDKNIRRNKFQKRATFFPFFLSDINHSKVARSFSLQKQILEYKCFCVATEEWNHCCQWKQIFNIWE